MRSVSHRLCKAAGPVRPPVVATLWVVAAQVACPTAAAQTVPLVRAASSPLPFRQGGAGDDFPLGGAILVAVLLVIAGFAWWARKRLPAGNWLAGLGSGRGAASKAMLRIDASLRVDAQTQLHVVHWNGREVLVATSGSSVPVVLDRASPPPIESQS